MMLQIKNYINGELVEPISGAWLDNVEPSTGQVYSQTPDSVAADIDRAVEAAMEAFPEWAGMGAAGRAEIMGRIADLIEANLDELARAESIDNGKPLSLARGLDIPRAATNLRFFAEAVQNSRSETFVTEGVAVNHTRRQPCGVAGCISPWNLPLYLFTWKIAPALATGNTVVGKPSEVTPMTAYLFSELCIEAGLPAGVLNIVHGLGSKVGQRLVEHPDVPVVSFTGGTATGRSVAATAGPMFKKFALELGGKNPTLVFADADYEAALDGAVRAGFTNQGEVCLCGSRIYVDESIHDQFVTDFVERARALKSGDPLEAGTDQGAVVSREHYEKIMGCIDRARDEGGEVLCGGAVVDAADLPERCRDGFFIQPTVITGLNEMCRTNQEEIFGPVVTIQSFSGEEEAVRLANCTSYGLAASLWTSDSARADRVADRIDSGVVWVNCWMVRDLRTPFGGMKQSGVGREGGDSSLRFFTEVKNVCVKT